LLAELDIKVLGLESIRELYARDSYFVAPYSKCFHGKGWERFHFHDGFLLRVNKVCIPDCSLHIMLLKEAHSGGLMRHFGAKKDKASTG
jgi:hypothetical protein